MRAEKSVTINAPAQTVFDYVSDFTKHAEWGSRPMEIQKVGDGPLGQGSRFAHTGKQAGTHHDEVTVTEFQPGSHIAFESKGDAGLAKHWFDVKAEDGHTVLTKGLDFVKPSTGTRLLSPMLMFLLPAALAKDVKRIKERLERTAS